MRTSLSDGLPSSFPNPPSFIVGRFFQSPSDFLTGVEEKDGTYSITAKEPGDNTDDGTFAFTIGSSYMEVITDT